LHRRMIGVNDWSGGEFVLEILRSETRIDHSAILAKDGTAIRPGAAHRTNRLHVSQGSHAHIAKDRQRSHTTGPSTRPKTCSIARTSGSSSRVPRERPITPGSAVGYLTSVEPGTAQELRVHAANSWLRRGGRHPANGAFGKESDRTLSCAASDTVDASSRGEPRLSSHCLHVS
jgi:hypothetical protein